jgi:hypothetical protein
MNDRRACDALGAQIRKCPPNFTSVAPNVACSIECRTDPPPRRCDVHSRKGFMEQCLRALLRDSVSPRRRRAAGLTVQPPNAKCIKSARI